MQWMLTMCRRMKSQRDALIGVIRDIPNDKWHQKWGYLPQMLHPTTGLPQNAIDAAGAGNPNATLLIHDKDVMIAAVSRDATILQTGPDRFKGDKEVVLAAAKQSAHGLGYAVNRFKDDYDIVLQAVTYHGRALQYTSNRWKNSETIVKAALENDGRALEFASFYWKNDRLAVRLAQRTYPEAIKFASAQWRDDDDMALKAVKSVDSSFAS